MYTFVHAQIRLAFTGEATGIAEERSLVAVGDLMGLQQHGRVETLTAYVTCVVLLLCNVCKENYNVIQILLAHVFFLCKDIFQIKVL